MTPTRRNPIEVRLAAHVGDVIRACNPVSPRAVKDVISLRPCGHFVIGGRPCRCAATTEARFWSMVDRSGGPDACWPWTGQRSVRQGYGVFYPTARPIPSHRFALLTTGVELDPWQLALHSCDNPPCCNPRHIRAGSHSDNRRDMHARGRARGGQTRPRTDPPQGEAVGVS